MRHEPLWPRHVMGTRGAHHHCEAPGDCMTRGLKSSRHEDGDLCPGLQIVDGLACGWVNGRQDVGCTSTMRTTWIDEIWHAQAADVTGCPNHGAEPAAGPNPQFKCAHDKILGPRAHACRHSVNAHSSW